MFKTPNIMKNKNDKPSLVIPKIFLDNVSDEDIAKFSDMICEVMKAGVITPEEFKTEYPIDGNKIIIERMNKDVDHIMGVDWATNDEWGITGFKEGHWYVYRGKGNSGNWNWNSQGEMDFVLDGKPHQVNKSFSDCGASFHDSTDPECYWVWNDFLEDFKEVPCPTKDEPINIYDCKEKWTQIRRQGGKSICAFLHDPTIPDGVKEYFLDQFKDDVIDPINGILISDEDATPIIKNVLREMEKREMEGFNNLDICMETGISLEQINRVLELIRKKER